MTPKVVRRERAKSDLLEHALYIVREQPDAARRFLAAAEDALGKLAAFPGMGAACEFQNPDLVGIRFCQSAAFGIS